MKYTDMRKQLNKELGNLSLAKRQDIEYINARISQMVQLARIDKGLTQSELAKKIGTKQPSIARLESGKTPPSVLFLNQIAKALDTYLIEPRFKSVERYYENNYAVIKIVSMKPTSSANVINTPICETNSSHYDTSAFNFSFIN